MKAWVGPELREGVAPRIGPQLTQPHKTAKEVRTSQECVTPSSPRQQSMLGGRLQTELQFHRENDTYLCRDLVLLETLQIPPQKEEHGRGREGAGELWGTQVYIKSWCRDTNNVKRHRPTGPLRAY